MQNKNIFRKTSLERLSSPEQLDRLIQITSPKAWVALGGFGIIITAAIIWGIFGTIATKVQGEGIFIKKGGLSTVYSSASGTVTNLFVKTDDIIKEGDVIATVVKPQLKDRLRQANEKYENLKIKHVKLQLNGKHDLEVQFGVFKDKKNEYKQKLILINKTIKNLKQKVENYSTLVEDGLITQETLIEARQKLQESQNQVGVLKNSIMNQNIEAFKRKREFDREVEEHEYQVTLAKQEVVLLENELSISTEIRATRAGRIVELSVEKGRLLSMGAKVVTVESVGNEKDLQVVAFVPAVEGKKIKAGMEIQISPSTVKREEFGYIKAEVLSISDFPVSQEGIKNILDNDQLVQRFLKLDTPLVVYAKLKKNPKSVSGFEWSSPKGPPVTITSGTFCQNSITVEKRAPITLIIPILKNSLGV